MATSNPDQAIMNLAKRVKIHRANLDISQTQLAKRCGLSQACIANIEAGTKNTSVTTLIRLSEALGVKPELLLQPINLSTRLGR